MKLKTSNDYGKDIMKRRTVLYFILIASISILILGKPIILSSHDRTILDTSIMDIYKGIFLNLVINICIGILLGMDFLFNEIKKSGKIKVYWVRMIIMGIPSMYLSLSYVIHFCSNRYIQSTLAYPINILISINTDYITIFQMVLGFIIITSFYKK